MKILILAAGYAVRLNPLTLNMPKSLLPVGGRPMIDRIIDKVASADKADSIYIITNAKFFEKFEGWLKNATYPHPAIDIINDGTASNETRKGAIADLDIVIREKFVNDDLLVVAGDNLFDFNVSDFIKFGRSRSDGISVALFDIKDPELASKKFGVVELGDHERVVGFEEKPEHPKSSLVSTGIYYLPAGKITSIREYLSAMDTKSDAPGYYVSWMTKHGNVYGYKFSEYWCDIGDIDTYRKADKMFKEKGRCGHGEA